MSESRVSRLHDLILIASFIGFISIVAGFSLFAEKESVVLTAENRFNTPHPIAPRSWGELPGFTDKYEHWFSDVFLFREPLVEAYRFGHVWVLRTSPMPHWYIVGKNGWSFLGNMANRVVLKHLGRENVSDDWLTRTSDGVLRLQQKLAKLGLQFCIVYAPNKHSIYPEVLPNWAGPPHAERNSNRTIRCFLSKQINVIPLQDALLRAKESHQVYYKTDAHWNDVGGYEAYLEIMQALGMDAKTATLRLASNRLIDDAGWKIGHTPRRFVTDQDDRRVSPDIAWPRCRYTLVAANGSRTDHGRNPPEPSRGTRISVLTENALDSTRIVFIRDSFGTQLARYLHATFAEVHHFPPDHVEEALQSLRDGDIQADIVMICMAERNLERLTPIIIGAADRLWPD